MSSSRTQEKLPDDPFPWTVQIKYMKTGRTFYVTGIEEETPEEAIAFVLQMGYALPKDVFELTAKRVPVLSQFEPNANANPNEPIHTQKNIAGPGLRAPATRK